jgi:hypothetical protein
MSDGYTTHFNSAQYAEYTITDWNGQFIWNPLTVITFTALIDPQKVWLVRDDTTGEEFTVGQTDVFDGWSPQFDPPYPTIEVRLPWWGAVTSVSLYDPVTGGSIYPIGGTPETTEYSGLDGMVNFTIDGLLVNFDNPRPGEAGSFTMIGGFEYGERTVYAGSNDFRLEFGPPSLRSLNITESRWYHDLVVKHPNGDGFPITKSGSVGVVSFDPSGGTWQTSYFYFAATGNSRPELPWYVQDLVSNERIGPNPTNDELIQWSFTPPPANLYMLWRFDTGVTFAWDSNGASLAGGYTIQRKIPPATTWTELGPIPATNTSYTDSLLGSVTAKYRVVYSYGNRTSGPSNELTVPAYNPAGGSEGNGNGGAGTGSGSGGSTGGTPPPGQDGPADNPDNDGLTNQEEIEAGTDRTKADTDEDGVDDGDDGWPQAKFLNTPRLPVWRYAVVELVNDNQAYPIALNNRGDTIYAVLRPDPDPSLSRTDLYYRGAGQTSSIPIVNNHFLPAQDSGELLGIADSGKVVGRWPRHDPSIQKARINFFWNPGDTSITYSSDTCSIPGQFQDNTSMFIKAGNSFSITGITPGGVVYGLGYVSGAKYPDANYYTPIRTALITGFARNGIMVKDYPQQAFVAANSWLTGSSAEGSVNWAGSGTLINNVGECIYSFDSFERSGDAPNGPSPYPGLYYAKTDGGTVASFDAGVAMNDDLHILKSASVLARTSERAAQTHNWTAYNAPRISRAKPYGDPHWIDFNNRLEAIGKRTKTEGGNTLTDWTVLINDHDYSIQDLVSPKWAITSLVQINEEGVILATALSTDPATTNQSIVLLRPVGFLVDANRDGEMSFDDEVALSKDVTTEQKPFRFWLNDDRDATGDDTPVNDQPDRNSATMVSKRDLEDFTRLWITFKGMTDVVKGAAVTVELKMEAITGNPSIKVFRHADETNGYGTGYVEDDAIASAQLQGSSSHMIGSVSAAAPLNLTTTAPDLFVQLFEHRPHMHFLFEGVTEGSGKLTLVIRRGADIVTTYPYLYLELKDIKKMYERKNAVPQGQNIPPGNLWPTVQFDKAPDEQKQAIVFVHGWQMSPDGASMFAETAFKRLWWRGFKGRFVAVRWPTDHSNASNWPIIGSQAIEAYLAAYNDSEHIAWLSGPPLASIINSLPQGYTRHVAAHSMGNIVVGSSLLNGAVLKDYALLQAAVPSACYDERIELKQPHSTKQVNILGEINVTVNLWDINTPDDDPDPATRALAYRGRLKNVAGNLVSFYLPDDYATSYAWELNNDLTKPPAAPLSGDFYYDRNGLSGQKLYANITGTDALDHIITDPNEAGPFAARTWAKAVGAEERTRGPLAGGVNLSDDEFSPGAQGGLGDEHSGEFNRSIQMLKPFYDALLDAFDIDVNP